MLLFQRGGGGGGGEGGGGERVSRNNDNRIIVITSVSACFNLTALDKNTPGSVPPVAMLRSSLYEYKDC